MAVVVEIEKPGRHGPATARDSCFGSDVCEGSVAVVVIKDVPSVACDEEVGKAVIVVIADRNTHPVVACASVWQAGRFGHISEAAILILAIKAIPVTRVSTIKFFWKLHRAGHTPAIYQENVEQTVVVVIEQGDAAGHGFNEVFLRRGRILEREVQTPGKSHIKNRNTRSKRCYAQESPA